MERTFKNHLVHPRCQGQEHLSPDHKAQSPIQPDHERFQPWGIHKFSAQPVPVSQHPHHIQVLPHVQSKPTLSQFKGVAPCPVTTGLGKSPSTYFISSLYLLNSCNKIFREPLLLQAEPSQVSQPFFIGVMFQPSDHFLNN